MKKNIDFQQAFLSEKGLTRKDINLDDEKSIIKDSLSLTKLVVKNEGSLYNKKNYAILIFPFLFTKVYSITDKINRIKGSTQSIQYFWKELMNINFENIYEFPIPVSFFEGANDYHVSAQLVRDFSKNITSPTTIVWFKHSGHFPQWEEPKKFNQTIIDLCLKETKQLNE